MAGKAGPYMNNDGLMFHYDTGNTVRSFRGEPTVNLVTPSGIDMTLLSTYPYLGRSQVSELSSPSSFACEMIVEDSTINSASRILFGGAENIPTSGNTFISVSVKFQGGPTSNITPRVFAGVGWTTLNPLDGGSQFITAEYRRFGALIQMGTSSGGPNPGFSMTQNNSNIQVGQKTRWHSPQVELKPHASPFVSGTRSNTQGLLDLTRNSTIDLANVSFDSNAQMTFDGTDDKIQGISTVHSHLSSSAIEFVVTPTTVNKRMTIGGYRHNVGFSSPTIGMVYIESDNKFYASVITAAQVYRYVISTITIQADRTYHVVFNKDTSAGVMQLYVNGVAEGSQTFNVATYAQWSSAGSYIGSDLLDFGKSNNTNSGQGWSGDFLQGELNTFRLYGRVLPASEVLQNFNATKGRYGL